MAAIISDLLIRIGENHAQLTQGLNDAKNQIGSFTKGIQQVGSFIKTAFAATAIIGFGKSLYDLAGQFDDIGDQLDALGQTFDQALNAGKAKAISDTFGTDLNAVLVAANSASKNFGISFNSALDMVQKGIALAGPKTEKYLKALESQADKFSQAGGSASQYFQVVTAGFRDSTEWEKQISLGANATKESFDSLVSQMSEGQQLQQRLVNSTAAFNSELASLFEGSGDFIDSLKISLYDLATKSLRAVKTAIVDTINYFIELYNESLAFRLVVQGTVTVFRTLWEIVKGVVATLVNGFSTFGKLIKAVLTGNFSAIPDIIRDSLIENTKIFQEAGSNIYDAFKDGFENAVHNKPISLIDTSSVLAPTTASNSVAKSSKQQAVDTSKSTNLTPITLTRSAADAFKETQQSLLNQAVALRTEYKTLGETIRDSLGNVAVSGIDALGNALSNLVTGQKADFKSLVKTILGGVASVIKAFLAESIAAQIKSNSKFGLPGLALAAVGIAGVTALFNKIPAFANGGISGGGLALVGERGRELVNLPRGSQVIPNRQTESMLSGGAKLEIGLSQIKVRGEDLYLVLEEVKRRRGI